MYALFEDTGKFQTGRILSEAESSVQIELESGRRLKAKSSHILLKFEKPAPSELMAQATALSATMELDLAWEFAPQEEFTFQELAHEYFSDNATLAQQAAALISLFHAPHYFRRSGKGKFKKASAEVLQQALAAIEKKKLVQQQIAQWAQDLSDGLCPAPIAQQLYKILFKPDKNAAEYKAVVEAARTSHTAPLALLQKAGAIASPYEFHWQRFLFDNFPKGVGFPSLEAPAFAQDLPQATVQAYSIDDSQTTEIDDALSIQGIGSGEVIVGIHIAAPALAFAPGHAIDLIARQRLSTVYMPGNKITMLPDHVVQSYTLQEGRHCPAVSLYLRIDENSLELQGSETRVESVFIAANLRHDLLDDVVTEAWLVDPCVPLPIGKVLPQMPHAELAFLYRLAQYRKAQREIVRGKPENFNRPDYNFRVLSENGEAPVGLELVEISQRHRGAPLDLIVAEAMILANSTWGQWLAELGVPGIYRSQASLQPGVKVRMGTKALPHAGIGVPSYAWSTSPLRRYTDLVNQWQIIACVTHGNTSALAAPFKPKDVEMFSIISAFEAAYSSYNAYQSSMERFWTLQYVQQNAITDIQATVFKSFEGEPPIARADHLPLVLPVIGAGNLARGTRVLLRLRDIDPISLDIQGQFLEVLQDASHGLEQGEADTQADEDDSTAGPLAIAVDMDETPTAEVAQP